MNVTLNQLDGMKTSKEKASMMHGIGSSVKGSEKVGSKQDVFKWDKQSDSLGSQLRKDKEHSEKDVLSSLSTYNEKTSKNFMVVMSNTMSDEDFQELMKNGGNPGNVKAEDMVTIVDEIKVTLAKAGVKIAGFTDHIDPAALAQSGIDAGYAAAIEKAMRNVDLPVTEDNVKAVASQMNQALMIPSLSDGAKQYLIENDLPFTMDNLYKASFSGNSVLGNKQGFYGAGQDGYMTKSGDAQDLKSMEAQMISIIEKSGMEASEETLKDAYWILENGLPLSMENLVKLSELNQLQFPMDVQSAAFAAADGISIGINPKDVDLSIGNGYLTDETGYVKEAISLEEKTNAISDDDLKSLIASNKTINLYSLFKEHENLNANNNSPILSEQNTSLFQETKKNLIQVQTLMSAQANLKLMKMGIHIDLEPLDRLASMLEKEEEIFHATQLDNILTKTEEIKGLPAETLGVSVREAWMANRVFTLDHVYEIGKSIQSSFVQAEKSYEALMTAPRADLGDSIKTAFRNVDDLLLENNMAVTEDNKRAVRICGYNQMEITEENVSAIKEADALLNQVISKMSPEKVLTMIRDGVNPLTMNLNELSNYLSSGEDADTNVEKYSKYLYRLEKNNEISAEEKNAYIGVYRLLRQIEKGDHAAIGSVLNKGKELSFDSLLEAIRTKKKGYLDATIDDSFGLLSDIQKHGDSISDQLASFFKLKAGNLADELASGNELREYEKESLLENHMTEEEISTGTQELESSHISVTVQNLVAEQMLNSHDNIFAKLYDLDKRKNNDKNISEKMMKLTDSFGKGKEALLEDIKEVSFAMEEVVENLAEASDGHIDVRSYSVDMRQISLFGKHSESESYFVPMEMNDEMTLVHVKIVNGMEKGTVTIDLKGAEDGRGKASIAFTVKESKVEGLVGVYRKEDVDYFSKIATNCANDLQSMGKTADITCVFSNTMTFDAFYEQENGMATSKELYEIAQSFLKSVKES